MMLETYYNIQKTNYKPEIQWIHKIPIQVWHIILVSTETQFALKAEMLSSLTVSFSEKVMSTKQG